LEPWSATTYLGHHSLEFSNRYLTPRRDAPNAEHIPFTEVIDPHGILEKMTKSDYIHTEENVVHYYSCYMDEDGKKR
jgi:hypothetical protein